MASAASARRVVRLADPRRRATCRRYSRKSKARRPTRSREDVGAVEQPLAPRPPAALHHPVTPARPDERVLGDIQVDLVVTEVGVGPRCEGEHVGLPAALVAHRQLRVPLADHVEVAVVAGAREHPRGWVKNSASTVTASSGPTSGVGRSCRGLGSALLDQRERRGGGVALLGRLKSTAGPGRAGERRGRRCSLTCPRPCPGARRGALRGPRPSTRCPRRGSRFI